MNLTEEQWAFVAPLIREPRRRKDGRGRPRIDPRDVLDGILWVLCSGARWQDLPRGRHPSYQTCHRRFQQWCRDGTLRRVLHALARDLHDRGGIDLSETFIDGSFSGAKKGALPSGRRSGARAQKSWRSQTRQVFQSPLASQVLRHTKSRSSKRLSTTHSWPMSSTG